MNRCRNLSWCLALCLAITPTALADIPGDSDGDGDVDFDDFSLFAGCQFGPTIPCIPVCQEFYDSDFDADLDMTDFAAFQTCFSGENPQDRGMRQPQASASRTAACTSSAPWRTRQLTLRLRAGDSDPRDGRQQRRQRRVRLRPRSV